MKLFVLLGAGLIVYLILRASRRSKDLRSPQAGLSQANSVRAAADERGGTRPNENRLHQSEADAAESEMRAINSDLVQPWATRLSRKVDENRAPLDAVLGLDFGTSSTKIVIQNPTLAGGRAVAVPFGAYAHHSSPYLLPTTVFLGPDDGITLDESSGGLSIEDIKVRLLEHPDDREAVTWCGAYMALAIRVARTWYLSHQGDEIGNRRIRWSMNVGIPSAGYDDAQIARSFRRAAELAWRLSIWEGPIDIVSARELANGQDELEIDIDVIPEVAAEVVGYARSPLRRQGLHVLMDIGATTLDVCSFVLDEKDGEDRYNLLTAIVEMLGTHRLHSARMNAFRNSTLEMESSVLPWEDPLAPIPDDLAGYAKSAAIPDALVSANKEFHKKCVTPLMQTLMALKRNRDPNSAAFRDGLRVFLCGGGSHLHFYRSIVSESALRFRGATTAGDLIPMRLEKPPNLTNHDVDKATFSRLAVAYGLSFDSLDIGDIRAPNEIEDVPTRRTRAVGDRFVSKDQV